MVIINNNHHSVFLDYLSLLIGTMLFSDSIALTAIHPFRSILITLTFFICFALLYVTFYYNLAVES